MKKNNSCIPLITILLLSSVCLLSFGWMGCAKKPFLSSAKDSVEANETCLTLGTKKKYDEGIECFEILKSRFAGSPEAQEADLMIGDLYFRKKEFLLAAETYLGFLKLHPTHEKTGYAQYRTGLSYLRESPKPIDRDQKYLNTAIEYLQTAVRTTSGNIQELSQEKLKEARTRIAKRILYIGKFYYKTGQFLSAIPRLEDILLDYPGLGFDETALYLIGNSYLALSNKEKAIEILSVFEQNFPASPYRSKLAKNIGVKK